MHYLLKCWIVEANTDTDTDVVWDVMIGINEDAVKWPYKGLLIDLNKWQQKGNEVYFPLNMKSLSDAVKMLPNCTI